MDLRIHCLFSHKLEQQKHAVADPARGLLDRDKYKEYSYVMRKSCKKGTPIQPSAKNRYTKVKRVYLFNIRPKRGTSELVLGAENPDPMNLLKGSKKAADQTIERGTTLSFRQVFTNVATKLLAAQSPFRWCISLER